MKVSREKNLRVSVFCKTRKYRISKRRIIACAEHVLASLNVRQAELSICLVSNPYIRKLNKRYKKRDSCTDVLAFPLDRAAHSLRKVIVGEIVISLDQTHRNAKRFGNTFTEELLLYVIHGVLHILGYDDMKESARRIMENKQKKLFNSITKKSISTRL